MGTQLDKIGGGVGQTQANENNLRDLGQRADELRREGSELPGAAKAIGDDRSGDRRQADAGDAIEHGQRCRDTWCRGRPRQVHRHHRRSLSLRAGDDGCA